MPTPLRTTYPTMNPSGSKARIPADQRRIVNARLVTWALDKRRREAALKEIDVALTQQLARRTLASVDLHAELTGAPALRSRAR